MQSGIYVGLSGQFAMNKRLETVANNVANLSTAGFRADQVKFETVLSRVPPNPAAFTSRGETFLSRRTGGIDRTDNPLDIALQGDAWLAIDVGGEQVYTRAGRMQISPEGALQTINGNPILDDGGAAVQLNPNGSAPQISRDGAVFQDGQRVGAIGLFVIDPEARLTRRGDSGVVPDRPAGPAEDQTVVGVHQGFIERSNVNPVAEMTSLITVHRMFDALTNALNLTGEAFDRAVREIGPGNP
jgi:flagellar basal-body rod protein FlgF